MCTDQCDTDSDISWPFCVYVCVYAYETYRDSKLTPLIALNEAIEMCAFELSLCLCVCKSLTYYCV